MIWSLSGGDPTSGPGKINDQGQYTPPGYLSSNLATVLVTATLKSQPGLRATSLLTLTPGFLQPLTPENAALGPNGSVTVTAYLAEAGGNTGNPLFACGFSFRRARRRRHAEFDHLPAFPSRIYILLSHIFRAVIGLRHGSHVRRGDAPRFFRQS